MLFGIKKQTNYKYMSNLLSLKMWFNLYPGALTPFFRYTLIAATIAFLIGTIVSRFFYGKNKKTLYAKIYAQFFNFSLTGLIIGALLIFFTSETIPFFSARFWFAVWFLVHAVWAWFIYKKLKTIPKIKEEIKKNKEYQKYIP